MMVGFVQLRDLNDNRFSVTVSFLPLCFYEISKTIGFVLLRDFNDGWFHSITSFILLRDFNDVCFIRL